jgi:hypothetical protein
MFRDFDAPASNLPADTSAAAIAAEGFFILSATETNVSISQLAMSIVKYSIYQRKNVTGANYYNQKAVKVESMKGFSKQALTCLFL